VSIPEERNSLARLTIPEHLRVGVAGLASMSDAAFSDFLAALEGGLSAENAEDVSADLQKRLESLRAQDDLLQVISAVASMQSTYHGAHNVTPDTFGKDIAEAMSAQAPSLAKNITLSVLAKRSTKIAEAKSIELIEERIKSLKAEVERAYCCARILTDVRAAFSENASASPKAMTILHTLRIGYLDDTAKHREFYLTLENADLSDLKGHIERAMLKGETLEALLAKADCRLFE
jgi:hypothetical protein